jgi:hypothetical protein
MHDPLVVAFVLRRPWPRRDRMHHYAKRRGRRWDWSPPFATVAGRGLYWPTWVTVWHREPGGHDSGEICKHYRHNPDTAKTTVLHAWRWHLHHWKIQVSPLQELRRRLLTRCAWCGGRSTRHDTVNNSLSWDGPRGRWWQSEPGLYHDDCVSIHIAHRSCTCADPLTDRDCWGTCSLCGKGRSWFVSAHTLAIRRGLATIPTGIRDRSTYERVVAEAKHLNLPEGDSDADS